MKRVALPLSWLTLVATLAACEGTPEFYPTPSDRVAEAVVSGAAIERFEEVDGWRVSDVLAAPLGATRVALLARLHEGASAPRIEARVVGADDEVGAWQALVTTWSEDEQFVARVELEFAAQAAQIRVESGLPIEYLLWSALVPERLPESLPVPQQAPALDREYGSVSSALRTELDTYVHPREEWGARATRCTTRDESKTRMAVHHTVTAAMGEPVSLLRGIQNYHMDGRGWCDVGYHFLVTLDGSVWEARPLEFLGSHVLNHNTGNIGVSFVGCYDSDHPDCAPIPPGTPPDVMLDGAARVIGRLAEIYDIPLTPERVMGHRDHAGASTVCPGGDLHALLGRLRDDAASGARFGASYVSQSFPLASAEFVLAPGEVRSGFLEMRNIGTETWQPGQTFLATSEPRLGDSPLAADDWVAPGRPASVSSPVAPGETGRFEFNLRAPLIAGEYAQFFGLYQLDDVWFSDAGEGGPPDDQLQVRVTVSGEPAVDAGPSGDAGVDAGSDGGAMDAGSMDAGPTPFDAGGEEDPAPDGCGCVVAGGSSESAPWGLLALAALLWRRRRR